MDFGILGPLQVRHHGRLADVGRPKQQALLAVLLLHANETVSVDRLAEDLWDRSPPRDLTAALQAHVSRLRSALAAVAGAGRSSMIVTRPPGYRIDVADDDLDVLRFRSLARAGRAALADGRAREALEHVTAALALWRGRPLEELDLGPLARVDIARLDELRLATLEDLLEAELELGRHREVLEQLDTLVAEHPLRERFWAQRITALYRSGRQAEALRAYGDVRRILAEELGISPSPELQALEAAVLEQRADLGPPVAPAPRPPGTTPGPRRLGNLPIPLTTFVGRADERREVAELLSRRRLVTLSGFGGAGKTRLALEVATDLQRHLRDGSWFVDLSAAVDGAAVGRSVARLLEVAEDPARPLLETLVDAVRDRELLLVLDNCEHLARVCADVASTLLRRCPGLRILATSREELGVPGEASFAVPPLSLPAPAATPDGAAQAEAVQLFADRASLVRRDFCLTEENAAAIASICNRLDGIPLAIELAAARVAVLSPQQIDQRLGDRFRLLADESAERPARHRTLAATMEWSDALLTAMERILLWRLSVFAGGFGLEAAESVCAGGVVEEESLLDHLARLVAKSLVVADTGGVEARYRLLEAIRQHGADRLSAAGEAPATCVRHARWCLQLAARAEPELAGRAQHQWLDRLTLEHDNLRAALAWAIRQNEGELALRLAGALVLFWRVRGHVAEGREWLEAALDLTCDVEPAVRAQALWGAGFMATMASDHRAAIAALEQSIELWRQVGDARGVARSLLVLGNTRRFTDGSLVALLLLDEAVALARDADDAWCLAHALSLGGSLHLEQGHLPDAETMLAEALGMAEAAGDPQGMRIALWGLGQVRSTQARLSEAAEVFEAGLHISRQLREPHATIAFATGLAEVLQLRGEHRRAAELLDEAWSTAPDAGPASAIDVNCGRGSLALLQGDPARARASFADALITANRARSSSIRALLGLAEASRSLGDATGARRFAEEALAVSTNVANRRGRAWALHVLGRLALDEGRRGEAWSRHKESLDFYRETGDVAGMAGAVAALGGLAAGRSLAKEGATLLAAARAVCETSGYLLPPGEQATFDADVDAAARALSPEGLDEALAAGRAMSVEAATDLAMRLPDPDESPGS